jgi:vancomycin resistance protein YoaR
MDQRGVEPTFRSGGVAWEIALALLVVALIVACAGAFVSLQVWLSHRILPGVQVWDLDVGGLTRDEAAQRLETSFQYPADRHPILVYGGQTWRISPEELGLRLDAAATAAAAFSVGHSSGWISRLKDQAEALLAGRLVMPVFAAEPGGGAMFLARLAAQVDLPLRNAALRLGDDLSVQVVPGQAGRTLDQEATRQALLRRLAEISGGTVVPIVQESEPLITDVSVAQAQTQRLLSGPVTLTAPGFDPWTIEPRTLAGWLTLRPTTGADGRSTLAVSLDTNQVTGLAEQIAAQVARAPTDAQFRWDGASGGIVPAVYSAAGQALDVAATVGLIEAAAAGDARSVALPLVEIPPALATEDAPKLGIVELIGEGITRFAGSSEARVQNIGVGASQFDGVLIAPGETFSFNQTLGEVTAEKGYAEGIIIWGNTTRADVGGGLCQVSSTAFRAAFWAGVPIVERTPHAFRVSYYEPPKGMDATIYSPSVDMKWLNDTGHYILIHTFVDKGAQTLTFRFYGTNPGRTVEMDGPYEDDPVPHGPDVLREDPTLPKGEKKQIEWAKDGLDVTIYRVVKENGVEVRRDMFFSRYLPWQAVYLVGTKE